MLTRYRSDLEIFLSPDKQDKDNPATDLMDEVARRIGECTAYSVRLGVGCPTR